MSAHRYWRLYMTLSDASGSAYAGMQLQLFDSGATNRAPSGTMSASSTFGGFPASNLNDGVGSNLWSSSGGSNIEWVECDFGSSHSYDIVSWTWKARNDGHQDQSPQWAALQYSDDGSTWFDVAFGHHSGYTSGQVVTWTIDETDVFKGVDDHTWWAIGCYLGNGGSFSNAWALAEVHINATPGGTTQTTGGTAFDVENFGGLTPNLAFDANTGTKWGTNDQHVYGSPIGYEWSSAVFCQEVALISRNDTSWPQAPKGFYVLFSDDGVTWNVAWNVPDAGWTGSTQTVTFQNPNGIPVTGEGTIGTITLSAPLGFAYHQAAGPIGTITLSAPTGTAQSLAQGSGPIGTLSLSAPLGSAGSASVGAGPIGTIVINPIFYTRARITQELLLVLRDTSVTSRVTQIMNNALAKNEVNARITTMALLVLANGSQQQLVPEPLALRDAGREPVQRSRLVNMYAEPTPQGPSKSARYQRGGLYTAAQRGGGPIRALCLHTGFLYCLSGNQVFRDGHNIGAVTGDVSSYARFADSENQVCLLADGLCYTVDDPANGFDTVERITDPDLPVSVLDIAFSTGRFIYLDADINGRWHYSDINDCTSIDGLGFATAEAQSDPLVGVGVLNDNVAFYGTETVEWWFPNTDAQAPFVRSSGRMYSKGCAAVRTITLVDNTLVFLGNDRMVYRSEGIPTRISDFWVEDKIRRVKDEDLPNCSAFAITKGGHTFYVINLIGQGTWACDMATGNLWAEWKSWNRDRFRVFTGHNGILGDFYSGKIYGMDGGLNTDDGEILERVCSAYTPIQNRVGANSNVILLCTRGVGELTGPTDAIAGTIEMRFSDKESRDFSPWLEAYLGPYGDRTENSKAVWRQLGAMRPPGRVYEFRCTADIFFAPYQAKFNEAIP